VRKAVAALLKHLEKEKGDKKNGQLFEDDQIFNLVRERTISIYPCD
jgi:hypothetical protein